MHLIPWKEGDPFVSLRRQMNRLFDDFGGADWRPQAWAPVVDVEETKDDVLVRAEIPGIDPKKVEIEVLGDALQLRGEKKEETEKSERNWHRVERRWGSFVRIVPLPCTVDSEKAVANAKDGVLTIKLAKREEDKARRIQVKVD